MILINRIKALKCFRFTKLHILIEAEVLHICLLMYPVFYVYYYINTVYEELLVRFEGNMCTCSMLEFTLLICKIFVAGKIVYLRGKLRLCTCFSLGELCKMINEGRCD